MANNHGRQAKAEMRRAATAAVEPPEAEHATPGASRGSAIEAAPDVTAPIIDATPALTSPALASPASATQPLAQPSHGPEFAAGIALDASEWSKKSFNAWNENATAMLDYAARLSKATSFDDVMSIQTRFFSERFDALSRQSAELCALGQALISVSAAPSFGARAT